MFGGSGTVGPAPAPVTGSSEAIAGGGRAGSGRV